MPVKHKIDHSKKIIFTRWEGEATDSEFIDSLVVYQREIQSKLEYKDYHELVDFIGLDGIKLSTRGLRKLGSLGSSSDSPDSKRKLALVVQSKMAYGMARMYVTYRGFSKKSSKEISVFDCRESALKWLQACPVEV